MSLSSESPSAAVSGGGNDSGGGEIMLFGVRVKVDPMRKSVSMNNLSDYEPVNNVIDTTTTNDLLKAATEDGAGAGYASADEAVPLPSNASRERKRGVPWTEEEHKLFLIGLQKVGKGDWRGISRNYVKTRTPTQVASHAQKYFLRRNNLNRRRRRSSLFDITTDSVAPMKIEEVRNYQETPAQPVPPPASVPFPVTTSNINGFSVVPFPIAVGPVLLSMQGGNSNENLSLGQNELLNNSMFVRPVPVLPMPSSNMVVDLNLNQQGPVDPLSLRLSLSSGLDQSSARESSFGFKNGESIITVA